MNQQQEGYLNNHYGTVNRSPSSSRPGYATTGGFSGGLGGMGNPVRHNQQRGGGGGSNGIDSLSQQVADLNMYGDDRFNTFNAGATRYDRSAPVSAVTGNFMFGNSQAWNYNANTATINGDPSRIRGGVNRRAPLPTEWGGMGDPGIGGQGQVLPRGGAGQMHHHYPPSSLSTMGTTNGQMYTVAPPTGPFHAPDLRPHMDDEDGQGLIKTAIVIKNIPFNVRKETLQSLMVEMNLPQPYAFNYHFDQGVFRGLAFANFAHPEETKIVISSMNGMEVSGRKLRVEYKKMLPEHERERIEREKREKRGQLEEQHRALPLQHQPSATSLQTLSITESAAHSYREHGIDLNNPDTLKFYIELFMFKKDATREILIFPTEITPEERRDIHVISHSMGFHHTSVGDGENRQVVVRKSPGGGGGHTDRSGLTPPTGATLEAHPRGLSRAATIDFAEQSRAAPSGTFHAQARTGGLLGVPGSPDGPHVLNGLRGVKSFADLRSYSPSPSPSVTSATTNNVGASSGAANVAFLGHYTTDSGFGSSMPIGPPQGGSSTDTPILSDRLGSLTRAAFDSGGSSQISRPREGPGAIGSQRPGANGPSGRAPERQPRGPGVESAGFGTRSRQNGHMQRGSDSSDNTRSGTTGSSWNH